MKKRRLAIVTIALALIVGVCSWMYLGNRTAIPENCIELVYENKTSYVDLDKLDLKEVTGETINGKGEVNTIHSNGIELKDVLENHKITSYENVTVEADDAYSAVVGKEEIDEKEKVYVLVEEEKASLVVFGDPNSKRNVRNVIRITAE
ncbi:MAG: hypothetical protein Q4C49_01715 [Bacillota bacterium]|nr:hypothetical protein [Bacillota bacterium]